MIFKTTHDGKRHQLKGDELKPFEDKLKQIFPFSFRKENPLPIVLKYAPRFIRTAPLYDGKGEMAKIVNNDRKVAPPAVIISVIERVRDEDSSHEVEYMYSKSYPQIDERSGRAQAKGLRITGGLKLGKSFDPVKDLDLIIFLYFFSSLVQDNARGNQNTGAYFVFEKPDQMAKEAYNKLLVNQDVYNMVINPKTYDSHADLRKVAAVVGAPTTGDELEDRIRIEAYLKDENKRARWMRVREDIIGTRRNNADMSEINDKVVRGIAAKVLRENKKRNVWELTTSGNAPVMDIIEVKGENADEKKLNLVQHLKQDLAAMEKLNELLPDAVPA